MEIIDLLCLKDVHVLEHDHDIKKRLDTIESELGRIKKLIKELKCFKGK